MTLKRALKAAALLEAALSPIGYHIGLTGGCLYKDGERKDADFIVYPHSPDALKDDSEIMQAIKSAGFDDLFITDEKYTNREIWISRCNSNSRCDFFLLS